MASEFHKSASKERRVHHRLCKSLQLQSPADSGPPLGGSLLQEGRRQVQRTHALHPLTETRPTKGGFLEPRPPASHLHDQARSPSTCNRPASSAGKTRALPFDSSSQVRLSTRTVERGRPARILTGRTPGRGVQRRRRRPWISTAMRRRDAPASRFCFRRRTADPSVGIWRKSAGRSGPFAKQG